MKNLTKKTAFLILLTLIFILFTQVGLGQVTTIDFETAGSGYTPSATEGSGFTDVFNISNYDLPACTNEDGYFWAVEDLTLSNPSIVLDQIDVTGSTSFTFSIDMVAHHFDDWDDSDELLITYSIDGGAYQNLMWVQNTGEQYNDPAALDTDFDGDGECANKLPALTTGTGTDGCVVSTSDFETFTTSSIALSGNSTLDITLQFNGLTSEDEGIYIDNIIITEAGASGPTITVNPTSLTGFTYIVGNGPSAEQSFTVEGSNLTNDISITPPSYYEISTGTGGSFSATNPITLTQSGGTVSSTTIYVRLKESLSVGAYNNEDIACTSTGATTQNITCSGDVTNIPTIVVGDNGTQVAAGNVDLGTSNHILSTFKLDVTNADATLTQADIYYEGSYVAGDIDASGMKLWYNSSNDFSTATSIKSKSAAGSGGSGETISFDALSQTLTAGTSGYFWVTADIASGATVGNTIEVLSVDNTDLTFSSGNKSGNASQAGTQTITAYSGPQIVISEVADPGDVWQARFVELYNEDASSVDLSAGNWYISIQSNGSSWNDVSLTGTIAAGTTYVIAYNTTDFNNAYGFNPDQASGNISGNGDDGYYLYSGGDHTSGTLVDAYGVIDEDGTGKAWEYLDSRAVRDCGTSPNTTWTASEWTIPASADVADMTPGEHCTGPTIDITGSDPTSDDFVQNSNDNIFYQIEVAVAGGTNQEVSQIQFDAVSTGANLDAIVSGYTLYYSTDAALDAGDSNLGTISSTATTSETVNFNFSSTPVTINSGNTGYFFITTNVLAAATVGATIQATNADATYTTNGGATDTENYNTGNSHTIVLLVNNESDIVTNGNEALTVSSIMNDATITSTADGTEVWQFTIRDGGADGTDADNLATVVNAITISQNAGNAMNDWDDAILACALFNGNTLISNSPTITANQIQFTGSPLISVPDEGSITLSLRISIQTSPNDNGNNNDGDDFVFQISQGNVTADATGSGFDSFSATNSINGNNEFEVTATELRFVQQPTDVGVNNDITPSPSVSATDINGTIDLDYTANISLSSTGTMVTNPVSVAAVAGIATFNVTKHSVVGGPYTLSATSGALTSTGNSNPFNVTNVTTFGYGDLAILAVNTNIGGSGLDQIAFVCFKDILPGTKFYLTDNGYQREYANQWGGTEGVISITRTSSTLVKGSIMIMQANANTNGNILSASHFDIWVNGVIDNNWTKQYVAGTGGFNLNSDDDVWIMQGGTWTNDTDHHSTYDGTVLYGWTESGWDAAPGGANNPDGTKWSTLYPNSSCFTTVAPTGAGKVKFNDPNDPDFSTTTNSQLDWIALINTTGNWDTYADNTAYNSGGFDYKGDTNAPQLTIASVNHTAGVWNGSKNTDWFDCSNWETLSVPDENIDVVIDDAAGNEAIVDASSQYSDLYGDIAKTKNMTIEDGIWVEVNTSADKLEVHGNLLIENNAILDLSDGNAGTSQDGTLDLYGNWTNNYDTDGFDEGQSTVNLLGTTTQTLTFGHTEEFNNLVINNTSPSGIVLAGSIDINGELTHTNGTIDLNTKHLNCSGVYSRTNGEFKGNSGSNLTFDGTGVIADLHFSAPQVLNDLILGRTETVNLQNNLDIYHELQIIAGAEIANNGNNITVRDIVDINGIHSGTGRIILSNTVNSPYAVQGTGIIGNIEMNSAGDDALLGNAINVNNFTITAGNSFDTDNYNMNVTGNWTNNVSSATFLEGTGTVTFNGPSTQTITAPNGQKFYNLVIDNPTVTDASLLIVQNDLTINAGDVFTINPEKQVTITGLLTNTPGTTGLVLKSDATGTASLIQNTANIPATVERYLSGNNWHYIFAPLTQIDTAVFTVAPWGDRNPNVYFYDESIADYWNGLTVYNPTGWTHANGFSSPYMQTDRGYINYFTADKIYTQTGGNLEVNDKTFNITLTDNNAASYPNYVAPPSWPGWEKFDGWNLVGNPYVSAVDWNAVTKSNIESYICYYDDADDQYKYYLQSGDSPWDNNGVTVNGGSRYIPAGQSFMVKATSNGTFTISANTRVHSSQSFYKKNSNSDFNNLLRIQIKQDNYTDETVIRTIEDATDGHDPMYDAHKMFSWNPERPQIYTNTNDTSVLYAVNTLAPFAEKVIPLIVDINTAGEYQLNMTENYFQNMHIWLEDKINETYTNLLKHNLYSFTQSAESNDDRFFLHFEINHAPTLNTNIPDQNIPINKMYEYNLPGNLFKDNDFDDSLTVKITLYDGSPLPEWLNFESENMTLSGTPSVIETLMIKVTATDIFGASVSDNYKLTVQSSSSSNNINKEIFRIYPNPVKDKLTVISSKNNENGIISVYDITGKRMFMTKLISSHKIINMSNFSKGLYIIEIKYQNKIFKQRIIKE